MGGIKINHIVLQGITNLETKIMCVMKRITSCPGRAGRYLPAPPQTRTCCFSASGSSAISFAMTVQSYLTLHS